MFKGPHFEQSVISLCVRWYLSYGLSLRDLKEIMAERGISVDHSTIHRWVVHFAPPLADRFNRRKRAVTGKWHADETYIKVRGRWTYLYRAIDSADGTVEFFFSEKRNPPAAKFFIQNALKRHGRPNSIVIDDSQPNRKAIIACDGESRLRDQSQRLPKPRIFPVHHDTRRDRSEVRFHRQSLKENITDGSLPVGHPDDTVGFIADLMLAADTGRIPIVDRSTGKLVGLIARKDLLRLRSSLKSAELERRPYFGAHPKAVTDQ